MRVRVESSYFSKTDAMLNEYRWLKNYNLEDPNKDKKSVFGIRDVYITVNSLEDLIDIIRKSEQPLILSKDYIVGTDIEEWVLEIYDGYRE